MARSILGVIAGYIAMFITIFSTFTVAFLVLGVDRTYRPGTYEVSTLWLIVSVVLGVLAALIGAWVCAIIARSFNAIVALAVLMLLMGAVSGLMEMRRPPAAETRPPNVSNQEAMMNSRQPAWFVWATPIIGAAVVLGYGWAKFNKPREPVTG